jgi:RHS repeat-associated protein
VLAPLLYLAVCANLLPAQQGTASPPAFATTLTNALTQKTAYQYDYYIGRATSMTDPNSIVTTFVYNTTDGLDRLSQVKRGSGAAQTGYTYNDTPNSVSVTTNTDQATYGDGAIETEVLYDGLARKVESRQYADCGYISVQQTYDSMGRPYQVSNPYRPCASESQENTTTLYDALNRPLSVTTADSSPTTMSYLDNQTSITDPAGVTRSTVTDAAGRTVSVTEAGTLLTSYLYDALNDLTNVCQGGAFVNKVCPAGFQPRTFACDSLARLTSATNPESGTTNYTYDSNGNLKTKTDANTNVTTLSYDALNRVTSKTYTFIPGYSTPNVTYCYDGSTQGACANAPSGSNNNLVGHTTLVSATLSGVPISSTSYGQYGVLGDIWQSTQTTGRSYPFTYTYNLANTMLGMTLPSGRTVTWTYDTANRIYTAGGTPPGGTAKTYASSISYASQGPLKQFSLGNGLVEVRSYDTYRQQLTGVSLGPSGSTLNLGFAYCTGMPAPASCTNNNGNLQSQTISPLGVTQTYTYDSYNRLYTSGEKAGTTTIWSEDFNYDSLGNRWVPSVFMGLPNPVGIPLSPYTPVAASNYNTPGLGYDANNRNYYNNNFGYDNAGNQTTISPFAVSYDVEGRQAGFTSASNGSASYTYDGDGRRVAKTAGGITTTYVYDATGNLAAEYSSQPPSMPCQTCYLTTDHLGSTRLITDQNGKPVSRHDFLPFGEELATSNRTSALGYGVSDNVMQRYTGRLRDLEGAGLDYFGARYGSSAQGRFTSPDPHTGTLLHVLNPQRWNMYAYAVNNPLLYVDPDGRDAIAVNFGNLAVGMGHWAIISVNRDGSATFSEFGPRGGSKPAYPGQYTSYRLNSKVTVGSNGIPAADTLSAVQKELAQHEGQPQGSISLAYFKTSDAETASLNAYIQAAIQAQAKGNAPFYFVGFNDCRDYCLAGLHSAGITTSHYANLNFSPNFLFQFLESTADTTYPSQPKKEKVDTKICYAGQPGCPVSQEQQQ